LLSGKQHVGFLTGTARLAGWRRFGGLGAGDGVMRWNGLPGKYVRRLKMLGGLWFDFDKPSMRAAKDICERIRAILGEPKFLVW